MKKMISVLVSMLVLGSVYADDLSNPAILSTNGAYAAIAGYSIISADGTNALAQVAAEVIRATAAETVNATAWVGRVAATEIVATNSYNQATNALAIARSATVTATNGLNQATNALAIANSATTYGTNTYNQATNDLAIANIATTNWVGRMDATEIVATNSYNQATNALEIANSAFKPNATNLLTEGWLDVVDATNLVFISNGGAVTTSVATWIAP